MIYIIASIVMFFSTVAMHIAVFRFLQHRNIRSFRTLLIFPVVLGLWEIVLAYVSSAIPENSIWTVRMPLMSGIVYLSLFLFFFILFFSVFNKEDSPSSYFYRLIKKKGSVTYDELLTVMKQKDVLGSRMGGLLRDGLVTKKKDTYKITIRGVKVMKFILQYRAILNWQSSG